MPDPTGDIVDGLARGSASFLRSVHREDDGLFPFSTRLVKGRYENDFDHVHTLRYTINTLLGLREAARSGETDGWIEDNPRRVERFLARNRDRIGNAADLGLMAVLLADEHGGRVTGEALDRIEGIVRERPDRLVLQDVSWMLWGTVALAQAGAPRAQELAHALFGILDKRLVHPGTLLPRHSTALHRRDIVSFGGIAYFLRASFEYARFASDERAWTFFERGVRSMLALQGPMGEWPWLISVRSGRPLEIYPVFSVHQDSMAMLFLLPATDAGLPGVKAAIVRSLGWVEGENELGERMYLTSPFFAHRSIRRREALPKPRRYLRAFARSLAGHDGSLAGRDRVTINRECRSYHPGWILYVWSGRRVGHLGSAASEAVRA